MFRWSKSMFQLLQELCVYVIRTSSHVYLTNGEERGSGIVQAQNHGIIYSLSFGSRHTWLHFFHGTWKRQERTSSNNYRKHHKSIINVVCDLCSVLAIQDTVFWHDSCEWGKHYSCYLLKGFLLNLLLSFTDESYIGLKNHGQVWI